MCPEILMSKKSKKHNMEPFNTSVRVTADKLGNIIGTSKKNPEYGYIRVEQVVPIFQSGWVRLSKRSALIKGKVEDLKIMGYNKDQELKGKIVIL